MGKRNESWAGGVNGTEIDGSASVFTSTRWIGLIAISFRISQNLFNIQAYPRSLPCQSDHPSGS